AITIGFVSPLIASALDAIGRPGVIARLSMGWTALNWLVIPFAARYGMFGFTLGYVVHVVVGNLAVIYVIKRLVPELRLFRRLWASAIAGVVTGVVGRFFVASWAGTVLGFIGGVGLLLLVYAGIV